MKVKVTATFTYETELHLEDYADIEGDPIKTDDDILKFERQQAADETSALVEALWEAGNTSDIKIEKLEETAAPAASEAA